MRNTHTPEPALTAGMPQTAGAGPGRLAALSVGGGELLWRLGPLDHLFIIRALILRELRITYQRTRVGFFMAFLQPAAIIVLHIFLFFLWEELSGRPLAAGIPIELFVIAGFTAWFIFAHTAAGPKRSAGEGSETMLIASVSPMHFRLAAAAWELMAMSSLCFAGIALSELLGRDEPVPNVPACFLVFVITSMLGFGFRLVLDALCERWPTIYAVKKIIFRVLFITAGVYFSASNIRRALGDWTLYNPLIHLLESVRHALYPGYPVAGISLVYPTAWALGLILLGLALNSYVRRWKTG